MGVRMATIQLFFDIRNNPCIFSAELDLCHERDTSPRCITYSVLISWRNDREISDTPMLKHLVDEFIRESCKIYNVRLQIYVIPFNIFSHIESG